MKLRILAIMLTLSAVALESASAQTWTLVNNVPSGLSAQNPELLTDGTVFIQNADTNTWWKLSPDKFGNYQTGTWKQLATDPSSWQPLYMGSEVMPDGRVYAVGGEYLAGVPTWSNLGGVYDPVKNTWTMIPTPSAWNQGMGDTATVTLPNGYVYVADPLTNETAAFNWQTNSYIFPYGGDALMYNDECGLTLMPGGNVYRTDCWQASTAEVFNTTTLKWSYLPTMPYNVCDLEDAEMGPCLVQTNGTVFQFGANGANIIWDPVHNQWDSAPSFPMYQGTQVDVADGGAVELPSGNMLVDAAPGYGGGPCLFYLWNGSSLTQVQGPPDADFNVGFAGNFLMLPNGQALFTDQTNQVEVYTPTGTANPAWAPHITSCPAQLHAGNSYTIYGTQFSGMNCGSAYGDDEQSNTNYPMIRITMNATGHVFFAREFQPSTYTIQTGNLVENTHFQMPTSPELGPAKLQVVTNGIASSPVTVQILPPLGPYQISVYPSQGTYVGGNVASVLNVDNIYYQVGSVSLGNEGQVAAAEADFQVGSGISNLEAVVYAKAVAGATEQVFFYNYTTNEFDLSAQGPLTTSESTLTITPPAAGNDYISPTDEVRVIVRAIVPVHVSTASFDFKIDCVGLSFF